MSHFSHKDILSKWTEYQQTKLNNINKTSKKVEQFELITFLCATAILFGSAVHTFVRGNEKSSLGKILGSYIAINTALLGIDIQRERKKNRKIRQLVKERKNFFHQFGH